MSFAGYSHTASTRRQLSEGMKGKPKSKEHARAISDGLKRRHANGGVMPHGTAARYKGPLRCRCDECRRAWRDYKRARRAAKR